MTNWLHSFLPQGPVAPLRERLRAALGAFLGIGLTACLTQTVNAGLGLHAPWLIAPLGASAVLVFAVPASPLAQPWAVVGGNTVSALWGLACVAWLGSGAWPAAVAVGGAIVLMALLRCLHPPGGAAALLVSLLGVSDPHFALAPVLLNSALLVGLGMVFNNGVGHSYPHRVAAPPPSPSLDTLNAELDQVLLRHRDVIDIGRDDLRELIEEASALHAQRLASAATRASR